MTRLVPEEAHVWLGSMPPHAQEPLEILSASERRRAAEIRHPEVRRQFLAGRVLARRALSYYAPVAPQEWALEATEHGRPEIVGPSRGRSLRFNLSHTAGLVSCVVTREADCGIDVETLDRDIDTLRVARHSFAASECARLAALDSPRREQHFFALWTLKEAYLKARGSGIRLRLDSAHFEVTADGAIRAELSVQPADYDRWTFSLFAPTERHRLAVAIAAHSADRLRLLAWSFDEHGLARRRSLPLIASSRERTG